MIFTMTDLTRSSTVISSHKNSMDSQVLSRGVATPITELTSSLEAATSTTSQEKKIGDLLLITM